MPESDFITRLSSRRPGLDALEPAWRAIDDVLAGRIKHRAADGWHSPYFPKGRLEPQSEYSRRIELTPFFPETPQLLASRLGALFKTRPRIELFSGKKHAAWRARVSNFVAQAGRRHASFDDIAVQAACLAQSHGFCAALLDRDPLPDDLKQNLQQRGVSQAEASARRLGRPYLALYAAPGILDWDFASDGRLAWVKFCEEELPRAAWDADPQPTRTFRIVDRSFIHVYRVRKDAAGQWQASAETPLPHGFGEVPVAFLHPFPAQDGIGRPILQRAVEADIAAARVLSDLVWDLFLLGNPILTMKTNRDEDELRRLQLGASRYIPLRNGQPGIDNPEALEFVQLDPTGIELLFRAHALFAAQALKSAHAGGDAALPAEQSGVAQAWRFKTGEERMLFMLARALEPFLSQCLKFGAEALAHLYPTHTGASAPAPGHGDIESESEILSRALAEISVRLPESFDVAGAAETLANAEKILELAAKLGQTELAKSALQRLESVLGTLPPERREAIAAEREALHLQA